MSRKRPHKQGVKIRRLLNRIEYGVRKSSDFSLLRANGHERIVLALSNVSVALDALELATNKGSYPAKKALDQLREEFKWVGFSLTVGFEPTRKGTTG